MEEPPNNLLNESLDLGPGLLQDFEDGIVFDPFVPPLEAGMEDITFKTEDFSEPSIPPAPNSFTTSPFAGTFSPSGGSFSSPSFSPFSSPPALSPFPKEENPVSHSPFSSSPSSRSPPQQKRQKSTKNRSNSSEASPFHTGQSRSYPRPPSPLSQPISPQHTSQASSSQGGPVFSDLTHPLPPSPFDNTSNSQSDPLFGGFREKPTFSPQQQQQYPQQISPQPPPYSQQQQFSSPQQQQYHPHSYPPPQQSQQSQHQHQHQHQHQQQQQQPQPPQPQPLLQQQQPLQQTPQQQQQTDPSSFFLSSSSPQTTHAPRPTPSFISPAPPQPQHQEKVNSFEKLFQQICPDSNDKNLQEKCQEGQRRFERVCEELEKFISSVFISPSSLMVLYTAKHAAELRLEQSKLDSCNEPAVKLIVLKNPFPLRTLTSKQPLYGVRLLASKGTKIESMSAVQPEIVLDERSSFSPPNLTSKILHEMTTTFYGYDLNFTSFKGSKIVRLSFRIDVTISGHNTAPREVKEVKSSYTDPFVILSNENQWARFEGQILEKELFVTRLDLSVRFEKMMNHISPHFLTSTRQPIISPPRPLSLKDLELLRRHPALPIPDRITREQFKAFFEWYGPFVSRIRKDGTFRSLWKEYKIAGFLNSTQAKELLDYEEEGCFLLRVSFNDPEEGVFCYSAKMRGCVKHVKPTQTGTDFVNHLRREEGLQKMIVFGEDRRKHIIEKKDAFGCTNKYLPHVTYVVSPNNVSSSSGKKRKT